MPLGKMQPPNPALRGFLQDCDGQSQPCWNGILLGKTTTEQAIAAVERAGYRVYSRTQDNVYFSVDDTGNDDSGLCGRIVLFPGSYRSVINKLTVLDCSTVTIGDIAFMAFPTGLWQAPTSEYYISLGANLLGVTRSCGSAPSGLSCLSISPHTKLHQLSLSESTAITHAAAHQGSRWYGFAPKWRYCHLTPRMAGCP
jgi:hypothetical protein